MKRVGFLYDKICDLDNIKKAIWKASKDKRKQNNVRKILESDDYYARKVRDILTSKSYVPTKPVIKVIQDNSSGKVRTIYKPNFFPDQIIYWALMLQIEPIIMRGMYRYSCGSVPGRGTSDGQRAVRKWLDKDRKNTKYCLKMDITKFYPSIDNEVLKAQFRRKIKDKDCLELIDIVIDQSQGQPIGFYTSQWFANFYLEGLDHYVKEELGIKYYIRYVDDLVLFGSNKRKLHQARRLIEVYCEPLKLSVKDNWQVFRVDVRDVDFLGVRFYRHKSTLRKRNALRIKRRVRKIRKKGYLNEKDASAVISYWGWIKRTDSFNYYHNHIKPYVPIDKARKVIKVNAKIRNNNQRRATHVKLFKARLQTD